MADLGLYLKREREARNVSLEEIASATKIVPRYLEALEADRFDIMPGTFFIKGIIRTYARYLGLDEEEILSRYRAAGALSESPTYKRPPGPAPAPPKAAPRPRITAVPPASAEPPEPRLFPAHPPSPPSPTPLPPAPPAPAHPAPPAPPPSSPEPAPSPEPLFTAEPAPSSPTRLILWAIIAVAIILALAVLFLLPTAKRPKAPPELAPVTIPSIEEPQAAILDPQAAATEPAPQPEPPGVTMEISFEAETWMQVYADGLLKIDGLFPPGAKAKTPPATELVIHVGNAGGFSFLLNGRPAKPLGRTGAVIKDIRITADNFKDFLQAPAPDPPAD
jgi:cytoskeleton protein RodZ